ncbi:Uncharacterised protein [Klebsiella pneumoniae]|nr:Uncharacterised protein [Klebsiella pneumoniae]
MEAPQEGVRAMGAGAAKHRAGNDPVFPLLQLTCQQILQAGAERRFDQPRRCYLRAAERNYPFAVELPVEEKLTNGDRVLIIEVPDLLIQAHRLQKVNMRSRQPRRVRPTELIETDLAERMTAQLAAAGLADVHFPVGQAREHGKTGVEGGTFGQNNRLRLRRQRIGVHGVNKDSGGRAPRERRFAERSGTQRRPLARRQQLLLYGVARQFGQRVRGVTGKRHRVIALDINHHRLQHAPFAAVDRADDPARRGGKADARDLFIFEQDLTFFDPIAFFNRHRGTHANVLFAE